jgi:hypothetical protein
MRQVDQDLNPLLYDLMAFLATNAGHEPDAAGIVLVRRIVKTLRRRQAVTCRSILQMVLPRGAVIASRATDLCISLVQRIGVKSTIQNFDAADGKFRNRHRPSTHGNRRRATQVLCLQLGQRRWPDYNPASVKMRF